MYEPGSARRRIGPETEALFPEEALCRGCSRVVPGSVLKYNNYGGKQVTPAGGRRT